MTEDEPRAEDLTAYKVCRAGDIVINRMRAFQGGLGLAKQDGIVSPDYMVLRLLPGVEPRYFHYLFRSKWFVGEMTARLRGIGGTDQGNVRTPRIGPEDLGDIVVSLPSAEEQRSIANFLDWETARLDALIDKKRRMMALLGERRISMIDTAVVSAAGTRRPVAALGSFVNGYPFKPDDFTTDGLPVIRIRQLVDPAAPVDRYNGTVPERVRLRDGDVVFSWSGSLEVRLWDRGPAILNQHLYRVVPAPGIDRLWLRFALDSTTRLFAGLMHGSAMTHITQPMMKDVRIPVPDLMNQVQMARSLDATARKLDQTCQVLSAQIDLLREHQQTLILASVRGDLELSAAA
jgi:type I restriction enzyme, S subunit